MPSTAVKFEHKVARNKSAAPHQIVPIVAALTAPASVVDVGCGTGNFLKAFKNLGITDVLGIDGHWANKDLIAENLLPTEFLEADLERFDAKTIGRKFDLALCLEVAEHLSPSAADLLVHNLTQLSNTILFSAAIPYQGGQNHINEQWADYWKEKFLLHDFYFLDLLRPRICNNPGVPFWFKQNLFLVTHQAYPPSIETSPFNIEDCPSFVHPELFLKQAKHLHDLENGRYPVKKYVKLLAKKLKQTLLPQNF